MFGDIHSLFVNSFYTLAGIALKKKHCDMPSLRVDHQGGTCSELQPGKTAYEEEGVQTYGR